MNRLLATTASALALLVGVAAFSEPVDAAGKGRCGQIIRGKVKLQQDLDCTGLAVPQLVGSKAHMDLNGHTLRCGHNDQTNSLKLRGRGALLRNGFLVECTIELLEKGDHKVRHVDIDNFDGHGIVIGSNSNEVVFSKIQSDANGIVALAGRNNLIADNDVFGDGAAIVIQNRSYVVNNQLSSGGGGGVQILGGLNRVVSNTLKETCIQESRRRDNVIAANVETDLELCGRTPDTPPPPPDDVPIEPPVTDPAPPPGPEDPQEPSDQDGRVE